MSPIQTAKMTNYRWLICGMLFFATMINYMDRQVLSLTWKDFIAPEFAWSDDDYSRITAFFSLVYAIAMLFAGRIVDVMGARKGYVWAMCVWSFGAILHGFCGIFTSGILTGEWLVDFSGAKEALYDYGIAGLPITTVSVYVIMACRFVFAIGQSGSFPAAISVSTEYFPKKDRAFAISVFNNGASVGALFAPVTIPTLARHFGWEMAFVVVGAIGYLWVLAWILTYMRPSKNNHVNMAELNYIQQDEDRIDNTYFSDTRHGRIGLRRCLRFRKTWALLFGRFLTDGVWWFYLFWIPVYISDFYGYTSDSLMGMAMIFVIYLISMLSIGGGYLPTYFVNRYGMNPFDGRMRSMLIFSVVQMVGVFAVPLGNMSPWLLVLIIGMQGASHQSWSANLYAMVGDFFPKNSIATITGLCGLAGGMSAYLVMIESGNLLTYAGEAEETFLFFDYSGKQAAYMILFCGFAFLYIIGWMILKLLVPHGTNRE